MKKLTKTQKTVLETVRAAGSNGTELFAKQAVTAKILSDAGLIVERPVNADGTGSWRWFVV